MPSIDDVKAVVGDLPWMTTERAQVVTRFIEEHDVRDILELGFMHGVSTCYLAAALDNIHGGHVVAIDRAARLVNNSPPAEALLDSLALSARASLFYEYSSYNWRLYHFLAQTPVPEFDLIYLDGSHTWEIDGFAFLLAERLLAPGGHVIFDDLNWSIGRSETMASLATHMPPDERDAQQVNLICEYLVKPHPNIDAFWEDGRWGYARKTGRATRDIARRDRALPVIRAQARDVRSRAEHALGRGVWSYGRRGGLLAPVLDAAHRPAATEPDRVGS